MEWNDAIWLILVGMLWGCTNPLMKYGSEGVTNLPKQSNAILQFLSEFYFLFTRIKVKYSFFSCLISSMLYHLQ